MPSCFRTEHADGIDPQSDASDRQDALQLGILRVKIATVIPTIDYVLQVGSISAVPQEVASESTIQ